MGLDHVLTPARFRALAHKALDHGGSYDGHGMTWDASLGCDTPIRITLRTDYSPYDGWVREFLPKYHAVMWNYHRDFRQRVYLDDKRQLFMSVDVPCRKCIACVKRRSRLWSCRAFDETKQSTRTWFCTYTLAPEYRLRAAILARGKKGDESFSSIYSVISEWFTRYLKRVRKQSGAELRFFLAAEEHADGFPHLHALIHENGRGEVSKRILQGQWPYGFTSVWLADPDIARYVSKYISKQMSARVRASLHYGRIVTKNTSLDIARSYDITQLKGAGVYLDLPTFLNKKDGNCSHEISTTTDEVESDAGDGLQTFERLVGTRSVF